MAKRRPEGQWGKGSFTVDTKRTLICWSERRRHGSIVVVAGCITCGFPVVRRKETRVVIHGVAVCGEEASAKAPADVSAFQCFYQKQ